MNLLLFSNEKIPTPKGAHITEKLTNIEILKKSQTSGRK